MWAIMAFECICTQIEADSTNGRKQVAWDYVTKYLSFHKAVDKSW